MFYAPLSRILLAFVIVIQQLMAAAPLCAAPVLLPAPGTLVSASAPATPSTLRGVRLLPGGDGLHLEFILEAGAAAETRAAAPDEIKPMLEYFLTALTLPSDQLWVNLSPYEHERVIPDNFGLTAMGRDLLAQDYLLKQLTASLLHPHKDLGKRFWDEVYRQAREKFAASEVPVDAFNKVWIVPGTATVYENGMTAFILDRRLRVVLDSDRQALHSSGMAATPEQELSRRVLREVVVPAIEKEVNEGGQFLALRRIYDAQILAVWFKAALRSSLLARSYADRSKVRGIDVNDPQDNEEIYQQYVESARRGVFNMIREEADPLTAQVLPRKYFAGGAQPVAVSDLAMVRTLDRTRLPDNTQVVDIRLKDAGDALEHDYFVDQRGRGLGEIFAMVPDARLRVPRWDKSGDYVIEEVRAAEFFAEYFDNGNVYRDQMSQHDREYIGLLRRSDNKELGRIWLELCRAYPPAVQALGPIHDLTHVLSLGGVPELSAKEFTAVWQRVFDTITGPDAGARKELVATFYEILRRWYKADAMPTGLSKSYRRGVAVMAGITMMSHGRGNAPAMDIENFLTALSSYAMLLAALPFAGRNDPEIFLSDKVVRELLARYRHLLETVIEIENEPQFAPGQFSEKDTDFAWRILAALRSSYQVENKARDPIDALNYALNDEELWPQLRARGYLALSEEEFSKLSTRDQIREVRDALQRDPALQLPPLLSRDKRVIALKGELLAWLDDISMFLTRFLQMFENEDDYLIQLEPSERQEARELFSLGRQSSKLAAERLSRLYIPAIRSNVLGEINGVATRMQPVELGRFLRRVVPQFQTKVNDKGKYQGSDLLFDATDQFWVQADPLLLEMVLERFEENGRGALLDLDKNIEGGLAVSDWTVRYELHHLHIGKKSKVRLIITNRSRPIEPWVVKARYITGRAPMYYTRDPLGVDEDKMEQKYFLWDDARLKDSEGGTSGPLAGVALWNMRAKPRIENLTDRISGQDVVRVIIDFDLADHAAGEAIPKGGIDLNEKNLSLDVRRGPMSKGAVQAALPELDVTGFIPEVIRVAPLKDLAGYLKRQ